MMFPYTIKARKNSGINDLFFWCDAKTEARAKLQLQIAMEDAGIEVGRGHDYQLPIRTDVPVFDDLPEEGILDANWCDRYELADDNRTWKKIAATTVTAPEAPAETVAVAADAIPEAPVAEEAQPEPAATAAAPVDKDLVVDANDDDNTEYPVAEMNFSRRLLSQFTSDATAHHIKHAQRVEIIKLSMDTDNSYVQNLLLATRDVSELQSLSTAQLWKFTDAIKTVFPMDKRHELSLFLQFTQLWASTEHIDRGILVREWTKGNCITSVQRTDTGTNAGGGNRTDRSQDMAHTLETLDVEIACALLPMDFDIYNIPGGICRRAKQMVSDKESPWKEWSSVFRKTPGILDYSRAAIFAVIRTADELTDRSLPGLLNHITTNLTETDHEKPLAETLALAMPPIVIAGEAGAEAVQSEAATPEQPSAEDVNKFLAAERGEYVESISDPNDPKWVHENLSKAGDLETEKTKKKTYDEVIGELQDARKKIKPKSGTLIGSTDSGVNAHEQMEATNSNQIAGDAEIPASEGVDADGAEAVAVEEPVLVEKEKEHSHQHFQLLEQRIERLESALAALGSIFNAPEEVAL